LLRLRHDIIMVGRAAMAPLPDAFLPLAPCLGRVSESVADYFRASAAAPSLDTVEAALDGYAAEFAALRREGFTRALADEAAERIFALGFALDQLRLHLRDLARCVAELGVSDSAVVADATASSARA
jgi:hypothetical protein